MYTSHQGVCAVLAFLVVQTWANNDSQPVAIFRSRPDLITPVLTIQTQNASLQAPGYYFIAPYQQAQPGIMIYDNNANLVYTGYSQTGGAVSHAPQTCQYKGETHLCFYSGNQQKGWGHGHGIIMDKHYRTIRTVQPANYQGTSDMHEFRLVGNGQTALMTQYLRHVYDLCDYGICRGLGYIQEAAFQEVDVDTGALVFEWRSLDHVDPSESWVNPGTTEVSGSGEQIDSPWDYFHINSIDKNSRGDYLISARHTSALYKISGKDGHVIWRLNGAKSDFHLDGFTFSSQHDARFVSENDYETVISIFDNGTNGFNSTSPHSTGKIIKIDHKTKTATMVQEIHPPIKVGGQHVSRSQGSFQILPGGNALLGWGSEAFWTEYAPSGEVAFYGHIGYTSVMNYRVHKFDNWVGLPLTKPALWTYSKTGGKDGGMWFYMSWNGGTEIHQWRIYGSDSRVGKFRLIDTRNKDGFETIYRGDQAFKFAYVEAVDKKGKILGTSQAQELFVPNVHMLDYCDDLACRFMPEPGTPEYDEITAEREQKKAAEQERIQEAERKKAEAEERKKEEERLRLEAEAQAEVLRVAQAERDAADEAARQKDFHRRAAFCGAVMGVLLVALAGVGFCYGSRGSAGRRIVVSVRTRIISLVNRWRGDAPAWSPIYSKLETEEDGSGPGYEARS